MNEGHQQSRLAWCSQKLKAQLQAVLGLRSGLELCPCIPAPHILPAALPQPLQVIYRLSCHKQAPHL